MAAVVTTQAYEQFRQLLLTVGREGDKTQEIAGVGVVRVKAGRPFGPGSHLIRWAWLGGRRVSLARVRELCMSTCGSDKVGTPQNIGG